MRKTAALALSAPLAVAIATPAQAQEIDVTFEACGTTIGVEVLQDTTRFVEREFGFQLVGNSVVRLHDLEAGQDSSVDIHIPGRLVLTVDPRTNTQTIVLSGANLLYPETPGQAAALAAAGLPEVSLVRGRVVIEERVDPETGMPVEFSQRVVSYTPHVTDVCALLPE
ncbi:hypothetical protein JD79_00593 [Geodermatophilus normandii]|uniref:DUF2993 domain-containing protein n=1 Tax=Geodermatophilus normandii TaxID=1137989 RepID=A0A317QEY6_9ACTN|nr:hypothetical protein [Geodermatophilus normandii]PWW21461.1 hypothetical protein JD79_00593 [Geodermatophilus normandii]